MNSVSSLMGEFSQAPKVVTPVFSGVMRAWVRGVAGRNVRLKVRHIDADLTQKRTLKLLSNDYLLESFGPAIVAHRRYWNFVTVPAFQAARVACGICHGLLALMRFCPLWC